MNKKIGIVLALLIIVIGIIITSIFGLNYSFLYDNHKQIDIYIGQKFQNDEIYSITKEVIGDKKIIIQKVELYEDMVSINVEDITEEQLQNLNTKINEKYGIENKVEDISISEVPKIKINDLIKPYIMPTIISTIAIIIYIIIYSVIANRMEKNIKVVKTIAIAIITIIMVQLIYFSIIAITRMPIGRLNIPIALMLYILTTIFIMQHIENKK